MLKLNILTEENDQEEEKKDDDEAVMNFNSTLKDNKVYSHNEIANLRQSSVCDEDQSSIEHDEGALFIQTSAFRDQEQ